MKESKNNDTLMEYIQLGTTILCGIVVLFSIFIILLPWLLFLAIGLFLLTNLIYKIYYN